MSGVGLLWTVRHDGGSFAVAGGVVGVFAMAQALGAPQVARAMDRYGQPRVLPLLVATHAVAVVLLVGSVATGAALPVLWAAAALAGASIPQPGALSAVRWTHALSDRDLLVTAFSLEAVANDVAFIVGPALVVVVGAVTEPVLGTALAAVLVVGGSTGLAVQRSSAPPAQRRSAARRAAPGRAGRRLWSRTFAALLVVNLALGALFGALQLSVAGAAVEHGAVALGGVVYALMSVTGLLGGIAYGARHRAWSPQRVLLAAASYLVVATGLLQTTAGMRSLALVLALIGAAVAPLFVVSTILTQAAVPAGVLTQALAWSGSASAAGTAVGAAVTGVVVQTHGTSAGFLALAAAAVVMTLAALGARSREPAHADAHAALAAQRPRLSARGRRIRAGSPMSRRRAPRGGPR
jgi:MFS family permease